MDLGISGRTALVTGADSGIGLATARELLGEGARVALTDVDQDALDRAAAGLDGAVFTHAADLTDPREVDQLHAAVTARFGAPTVVVHAAGVTGAQGLFHEIGLDGWRSTFDTDFFAAVHVARAFLPHMREAGWGRLVFVTSEDAVQPYPDELPYCAAKAAVDAWTVGTAVGARAEGVWMTSLCPGYVRTPMTAGNRFPMPGLMDAERAARVMLRGVAAGRRRVAFPWWVAALARLTRMVTQQAAILAIDEAFWMAGWVFLALAGLVWLARPTVVHGRRRRRDGDVAPALTRARRRVAQPRPARARHLHRHAGDARVVRGR